MGLCSSYPYIWFSLWQSNLVLEKLQFTTDFPIPNWDSPVLSIIITFVCQKVRIFLTKFTGPWPSRLQGLSHARAWISKPKVSEYREKAALLVYRTCKINRTHGDVVEPHKWWKGALSYLHNCEENQHSLRALWLCSKNSTCAFSWWTLDILEHPKRMLGWDTKHNSFKARQEKREAYQIFIKMCIYIYISSISKPGLSL